MGSTSRRKASRPAIPPSSAIVYLLLGMMLARVETSYAAKVFIFAVCALITLAVGMSRIYLGVHWPTDVMAGWAVGSVWVLLCWYVLLKLQPSGTRQLAYREATRNLEPPSRCSAATEPEYAGVEKA